MVSKESLAIFRTEHSSNTVLDLLEFVIQLDSDFVSVF